MRKIKNVLAILLGATIMLGSSVMVGAKNDNFIFNLYTTQTSGVNIKEDTADAVVNTLSVSSTGNSVGYSLINVKSFHLRRKDFEIQPTDQWV